MPSVLLAWIGRFAGIGSDKGLDAASLLAGHIKRLAEGA